MIPIRRFIGVTFEFKFPSDSEVAHNCEIPSTSSPLEAIVMSRKEGLFYYCLPCFGGTLGIKFAVPSPGHERISLKGNKLEYTTLFLQAESKHGAKKGILLLKVCHSS